jgi:hypothetical protein
MSLNTYIQEINDQVKLLRQDVLDLQRENRELKTHTHVAVDDTTEIDKMKEADELIQTSNQPDYLQY